MNDNASAPPANRFRVAAVQAAPAFLDLAGTVAKTVRLIGDAAAAGAKLVAFPECWCPGYPWWIWLGSPAWGLRFMVPYLRNALRRDSAEMARICAAAREHRIVVVLGYAEAEGGTLYMAQSIIGDDGRVLAHRRKLKPARIERSVFGQGDGSDLAVVDTRLGRVGALCCGEHFQPLLKCAMIAQGEQIHVAAWPAFSLLRGKAYLNGPEAATVASQMYAIEGQCFVLAPTMVNDEAVLAAVCDTDDKRAMLSVPGKAAAGGRAMIFAPDGKPMAEFLPEDQEGLVIAEIDTDALYAAKTAGDTLGHWARPDVVRLMLDRAPKPKVVEFGESLAAVPGAPR